MKVKFIKDKEYDVYMIWAMVHNGGKDRYQDMDFEEALFNKLEKADDFNDIKNELTAFVNDRYSQGKDFLERVIPEYQASWDKINDTFFSEVQRITGYSWKFPQYEVVVSLFSRGLSNRDGNKVVRWAYDDKNDQKRITAHEILMTHIWNIFDNKYLEAKDDIDEKFWGLNEITTVAILGLEPTINSLWTSKTQGYDQYLANYPELKDSQTELKDIYLNKKDFNDYLDKAVDRSWM